MEYHVKNKIRELRFINQEMSQDALANLVGVSRQTIHAIEKDKYSPSLELAFRIAEVFGVPISEVFYYEKDPRTSK